MRGFVLPRRIPGSVTRPLSSRETSVKVYVRKGILKEKNVTKINTTKKGKIDLSSELLTRKGMSGKTKDR